MTNLAIRVEKLGKQYHIGGKQERYKTLRDTLTDAAMRPVRALRTMAHRKGKSQKPSDETIWALRDVTFDVEQGEVIGVIGRNGAGKSTLLKILSRITDPTEGYAEIHGRVGSLLEVGTGFHLELTGRENIFLNGAILGMSKTEIGRKFDEIVDFAELDKFIDTPVKHYSSGMYLRLAFGVAAQLEPEILLVDEVLAVGDAAFQKKCLGKMGEVAEAGRTVLFVSHNLGAVAGLCKRAIWIDGGMIRADGPVDEVTEEYLSTMAERTFQFTSKEYDLSIQSVLLKNAKGEESLQYRPGEDLLVEISYDAKKRIKSPVVILVVKSIMGSCFTANMLLDGQRPEAIEGQGTLKCKFKSLPLLPQNYFLSMSLRNSDAKEMIVKMQEVASFSVVANLEEYGFEGEHMTLASKSTAVVVPYEWVLPDGSVRSIDLRLPLKPKEERLAIA